MRLKWQKYLLDKRKGLKIEQMIDISVYPSVKCYWDSYLNIYFVYVAGCEQNVFVLDSREYHVFDEVYGCRAYLTN
jgi:hypothetical protein